MIAADEHHFTKAIRDWLGATSDISVPTGLSREEARIRAHDLGRAIFQGTIAVQDLDVDAELLDVLWALAEELEEQERGAQLFRRCDLVYQFVSALRIPVDSLDEKAEVLRRIAGIGWSSVRDGLERVFAARASIFEHGDEAVHRELCDTADQLPGRIEELDGQRVVNRRTALDICGRLLRLTNIRPALVASAADHLGTVLRERGRRVGRLDERSYFIAITDLVAGTAARQLGKWEAAGRAHIRAAAGFRRTISVVEIDRVTVESLAVATSRLDGDTVLRAAPGQIQRLTIPREKLKAHLILANAFIQAERPEKARALLEQLQNDSILRKEPALHVWLLLLLGNARSDEGDENGAVESFSAAASLLARYQIPNQLGTLLSTVGEFFGKLGKLEMAAAFYARARKVFREYGHSQQVGYLSVLRAEVLLLLGKVADAEAELVAVLPLIERFELRREGVAAVALLREAISMRRVDVKTIRGVRDLLERIGQ